MIRWLVLAAVACGASHAPPPATPLPAEHPVADAAPPPKPVTRREQMMNDMAALTDEMCACKAGDRECAARVQKKLADFGQDNDDMANVKMSDAERARAAELTQKIAACSATAMQSAFLTDMVKFKDEICACNDSACVSKVMGDMQAYAQAHPELAHAKMTAADEQIARQLSNQAVECAARAGRDNAPPGP